MLQFIYSSCRHSARSIELKMPVDYKLLDDGTLVQLSIIPWPAEKQLPLKSND